VDSLQIQLLEQEEATKSVIDQWQEACVSAEERCAALETELGNLKESLPSPTADSPRNDEAAHLALRESLDQKERDLEAAVQTIENNDSTILDLQGMYETEV
jgi:chromosome segregation ATPase